MKHKVSEKKQFFLMHAFTFIIDKNEVGKLAPLIEFCR